MHKLKLNSNSVSHILGLWVYANIERAIWGEREEEGCGRGKWGGEKTEKERESYSPSIIRMNQMKRLLCFIVQIYGNPQI